MKKLLAVLLLLARTQAFSQTPNKVKIYVDCSCTDIVGSQYATALRDAIARSPRFELASSASEGTGKDMRYNWTLSIVSVDSSVGSTGVATAISVVLAMGNWMFDQHVQTCGAGVVANCAAISLASADNEIQNLGKK